MEEEEVEEEKGLPNVQGGSRGREEGSGSGKGND